MAEHAVLRQRNYDAAIQHYKEALTFDANDEVISKTKFILDLGKLASYLNRTSNE